MIYELAYKWYDDYEPYLFEGDGLDESGWAALCNSLLPAAVDDAIKANPSMWVGWGVIVEAMAGLLESRGFKRIRPIAHDYFGSCIIEEKRDDEQELPRDAMEKVVSHNGRIRQRGTGLCR